MFTRNACWFAKKKKLPVAIFKQSKFLVVRELALKID